MPHQALTLSFYRIYRTSDIADLSFYRIYRTSDVSVCCTPAYIRVNQADAHLNAAQWHVSCSSPTMLHLELLVGLESCCGARCYCTWHWCCSTCAQLLGTMCNWNRRCTDCTGIPNTFIVCLTTLQLEQWHPRHVDYPSVRLIHGSLHEGSSQI
jgi:hypothetical protein